MRRVALIYNPASGRYSARRKAAVEQALAVIRQAGAVAEAFETKESGQATHHAREAVAAGFDTVLACGGDGTVHEAVQSLVGTDVALGVIPLGTANALAASLSLLGSPAKVARKLLDASSERISVGRVHYRDLAGNSCSRYFVVAAGIGPDALVMARMDAGLKRRLGYSLYIIECFRTWATFSYPLFEATLPANGHGDPRAVHVSQLLAVRVRSFGGALRELAPGASLSNGKLSLLAFKTQSRLHYFRFIMAALAGRQTFNGPVELLETPSIDCRTPDNTDETLMVEADGEVLGSLPVRLEIVPQSLTVLVPRGAKP
jgi:YegS/Rv2252/BmrU family lipid kinase